MASISNAMWRRIGDQPFGLGIERYENSDKEGLWRLRVTRNASTKLIEVDAEVTDLREIIRFCEQAIDYLQTDGGRIVDDTPRPAEAA